MTTIEIINEKIEEWEEVRDMRLKYVSSAAMDVLDDLREIRKAVEDDK